MPRIVNAALKAKTNAWTFEAKAIYRFRGQGHSNLASRQNPGLEHYITVFLSILQFVVVVVDVVIIIFGHKNTIQFDKNTTEIEQAMLVKSIESCHWKLKQKVVQIITIIKKQKNSNSICYSVFCHAMLCNRGLCRHAVSVCLSVFHVREFICRNE